MDYCCRIIKFISSKKKPPKIVVKKAIILSAVIAFGIWSIQLIIVELYLSRYFGIDLYEQDIRSILHVFTFLSDLCFYLKIEEISRN